MVDYPLEVDPDNCALPDFRRAIKKITPLPNLDFKIRRANSLIEQIRGHAVKFPQTAADSRDFALSLSKLATAKHRFYEARRKKDKRLAQLDILEATAELAKYEFNAAKLKFGLLPSDQDAERAAVLDRAEAEMGKLQMQIAAARKKNEREKDDDIERLSRVFNDEAKPTFVWQLDFAEIFHRSADSNVRENLLPDAERGDKPVRAPARSGFDLVLANPPYLLIQNMGNAAPLYQDAAKNYFSAQYKIDLYHLFIEAGVKLLNGGGVLGYITPNTFLKNKHCQKLRELLVLQTKLRAFVLFYYPVFEDPSVDNVIFLCQKPKIGESVSDSLIRVHDVHSAEFDREIKSRRYVPQVAIRPPEFSFELDVTAESAALLTKIERKSIPFGQIGGTYFGIQTFDRESFVSTKRETKNHRPVIDGYNVIRWNVITPSEFVDFLPKNIKSGGDPTIYAKPRIVVRQIGRFPEGAICPDGVVTLNTIYNIYLNTPDYDIRFVLCVINSAVTRFYWLTRFFDNKETFPKIKKKPLESIRIPAASAAEQAALSGLVDGILAAQRTGDAATVTALETEIDAHVFRLYALTPAEIELVKGSAQK